MEGYVALAIIDENSYPTAPTLTIARAEGIKWLYVCALLDTNKVKRIGKCSRAAVCVNSSEHNITLVGTAEVLTDEKSKNDNWLPVMNDSSHWRGGRRPKFLRHTFFDRKIQSFCWL